MKHYPFKVVVLGCLSLLGMAACSRHAVNRKTDATRSGNPSTQAANPSQRVDNNASERQTREIRVNEAEK